MWSGMKYLVWGKRTPRKLVFGVGLFTIGAGLTDWLKAPIMHNTSVREAHSLRRRYGEGSYAVVTGATDPTGEAFCDQLTKQGF